MKHTNPNKKDVHARLADGWKVVKHGEELECSPEVGARLGLVPVVVGAATVPVKHKK